jgi:hypothetical protein
MGLIGFIVLVCLMIIIGLMGLLVLILILIIMALMGFMGLMDMGIFMGLIIVHMSQASWASLVVGGLITYGSREPQESKATHGSSGFNRSLWSQ